MPSPWATALLQPFQRPGHSIKLMLQPKSPYPHVALHLANLDRTFDHGAMEGTYRNIWEQCITSLASHSLWLTCLALLSTGPVSCVIVTMPQTAVNTTVGANVTLLCTYRTEMSVSGLFIQWSFYNHNSKNRPIVRSFKKYIYIAMYLVMYRLLPIALNANCCFWCSFKLF